MDNEIKKNLWNELSLLQAAIDKFDDFSFRIKNWFLTIFVAIIGYAVVNGEPTLICFNFGVIGIFYFYEITYRISHGHFLKRSREVQCLLREEGVVNAESKPPNLDKYILASEGVSESRCLYWLQKK